ncbi:MAG: clostripain-related cysteine peptidase [bacterium]
MGFCNGFFLIALCALGFSDFGFGKNACWTVLNYIEADNNVFQYGLQNIRTMQRVGSTEEVTVLTQLDVPNSNETLRYKLSKGGICQDDTLPQEMGINPETELSQSIIWAQTKYPSDRFMLILWNHGNGILDEPAEQKKKQWEKRKRISHTRGILYDFSNNTFLDNQGLDRALSNVVAQNNGKKIDVIGMDACLMAMIEVGYQIKDYARFFVASQNVEDVPGWGYHSFLSELTQNPTIRPKALAQAAVNAFETINLYNSNFTQSAVNLNKLDPLKNDVNTIVDLIGEYKKMKPRRTEKAILEARDASPQFYRGNYIDLYSFYKNLLWSLKSKKDRKNKCLKQSHHQRIRLALRDALKGAMKNIRKTVVLCKNGRSCAEAQGISIYYPLRDIHPSYALTKFAVDTKWLDFISEYKVKSLRRKIKIMDRKKK